MQVLVVLAQTSTGMALPNDFFTTASLASFAGLSAATFVVTNTIRVATKFDPPWLGLPIALIATEIGVFLTSPHGPGPYLLGILNGCLVFLTAAGGASAGEAVTARVAESRGVARARAQDGRPDFLSSWF